MIKSCPQVFTFAIIIIRKDFRFHKKYGRGNMLNKEKISNLIKILKKKNMDGCLITPGYDLEYLTETPSFTCERFRGFFVLTDDRYFSICPSLYYEETRNTLGEDTQIYVWTDSQGVTDSFIKAEKDYKLSDKTLAINEGVRAIDLIDMSEIIKSKFVNGHSMFEDLRVIKNEEEIGYLAKAAEIADNTFKEIIKFIKPGIREKDIANKIKELLVELGGSGISFDPIVASGPNSSKPHYSEDSRVIEEQDLIILDYGCKYKGYCSDISRTVFVGQPTEEQKKVYEIALKANMEAEKGVKEGVTAHEIDAIAQKVIRDSGYGEYILSRTGHGIGIAVHEAPYIREGNEQILKTGMAFSVEPGIYIAGKFGIRVEDIVVVDGDGVNILNKAPKEMTIV